MQEVWVTRSVPYLCNKGDLAYLHVSSSCKHNPQRFPRLCKMMENRDIDIFATDPDTRNEQGSEFTLEGHVQEINELRRHIQSHN